MDEVAFENARTASEFFTSSGVQKILRQQQRHLNAIGAYLVTGFYTFVRASAPTTPGLRGSRPGALINAVGGANQLAPENVAPFAT